MSVTVICIDSLRNIPSPPSSQSPVLKHIFRLLRCRLPKHFQPTSTQRDFQYHTGLEKERMALGWTMYDPQKPLRVKVYNSPTKFSYLVTVSKKQYCPSRVNFTVQLRSKTNLHGHMSQFLILLLRLTTLIRWNILQSSKYLIYMGFVHFDFGGVWMNEFGNLLCGFDVPKRLLSYYLHANNVVTQIFYWLICI